MIVSLAGIFLLVGGGWGWAWWHAAGIQTQVEEQEGLIAQNRQKIQQIRADVMEFDRKGTSEYYRRMLPDDESFVWVELLRFFDDLEREAGIVILSGGPDKQGNQRAKSRKSKDKHQEYWIKMTVSATFEGLLRFLEGLEREVDRDQDLGGGRLFEVRGIKTLGTATTKRPEDLSDPEREAILKNVRNFELKIVQYTLKTSP